MILVGKCNKNIEIGLTIDIRADYSNIYGKTNFYIFITVQCLRHLWCIMMIVIMTVMAMT